MSGPRTRGVATCSRCSPTARARSSVRRGRSRREPAERPAAAHADSSERRESLLEIYDPGITDDGMIRMMKELPEGRADTHPWQTREEVAGEPFDVRPFPPSHGVRPRWPARVRRQCQSLRKLELDERREVGLIVRAAPIVKEIQRVFERRLGSQGRRRRNASQTLYNRRISPNGRRRPSRRFAARSGITRPCRRHRQPQSAPGFSGCRPTWPPSSAQLRRLPICCAR